MDAVVERKMENLLPVEEEIKRYLEAIEPRDVYGLNETHSHLLRLGYHHNKNFTNSVLMGLCFEGSSIFLGWHKGYALYQRME